MFKYIKQKRCKHKYSYVGTIEKISGNGLDYDYYIHHVAYCPACEQEIQGSEDFIKNKIKMSELYWVEYLDKNRELR